MQKVKNELYKVVFATGPWDSSSNSSVRLATHVYRYDRVRKSNEIIRREGSGILIDIYNQREKEMSSATPLTSPQNKANEIEEVKYIKTPLPLEDDIPTITPDVKVETQHFKRLKRKGSFFFDYTEIERSELIEEKDRLINQDGYYNEILPIDHGKDFKPPVRWDKQRIVILSSLILVILISGFVLLKQII